MRSADVIIVGLGAMGSAASRQLAACGVSVIGIDHRDLNTEELRTGFPMFAADEDTIAYHEPQAE
jgi:flavin-dependent dehydrogenase